MIVQKQKCKQTNKHIQTGRALEICKGNDSNFHGRFDSWLKGLRNVFYWDLPGFGGAIILQDTAKTQKIINYRCVYRSLQRADAMMFGQLNHWTFASQSSTSRDHQFCNFYPFPIPVGISQCVLWQWSYLKLYSFFCVQNILHFKHFILSLSREKNVRISSMWKWTLCSKKTNCCWRSDTICFPIAQFPFPDGRRSCHGEICLFIAHPKLFCQALAVTISNELIVSSFPVKVTLVAMAML